METEFPHTHSQERRLFRAWAAVNEQRVVVDFLKKEVSPIGYSAKEYSREAIQCLSHLGKVVCGDVLVREGELIFRQRVATNQDAVMEGAKMPLYESREYRLFPDLQP